MGFWSFFKKGDKKAKKLKIERHFRRRKNVKIGLALSGGAARGIGHIGVIKAFEEMGVDFDIIVGTSAGSFVGALYSYGWTSQQMMDALATLKTKDIRKSNWFILPSTTDTMIETIEKLMGGQKVFSDLKKRFVAVATNLKTGKEVRIESGSVAKAVACSCAVPGAFKPVKWDDKLLCDGGLVNSVPVNVCRELGADYVIAVDVNMTRGDGREINGFGDLINSTIGIMLKSNATSYLDLADFVLAPELKSFKSSKLENAIDMIREGERVVNEHKDEIIKILNAKPKKKDVVWVQKEVEHI